MPADKKSASGGSGGDSRRSKVKKVLSKHTNTSSDGGSSDGTGKPDAAQQRRAERKRKDGTTNKMSFDVDELEEGMYVEVEDDENIEEVVEYEEVPDDESSVPPEGKEAEDKKEAGKDEDLKAIADKPPGYKIRPDLVQKFRPGAVQVLIERSIKDKLEGKEYSPEQCEEWVQQIMADVHEKVKALNYRRYKIITQVSVGERRGEGASSATRCLWDAEADCMATYTFLNDSIFCNGTVYGIYFY